MVRFSTAAPCLVRSKRLSVVWLLALGIVALAFALRVYHLGTAGLDYDEAFSVQAGFHDIPGILSLLASNEPHPPFYYVLIHFWYPVTGTTGFALRFPSLAANVLTVAFLIRVAAWLGWKSAGLVGAVLLAFNPFQIWYSQEARMYAPVALFGLAALFFGLTYLARGRWRSLVGAAVFMLLALAAHYYAIFLFIFINGLIVGALLVGKYPPTRLWRWLAAQAIVGVLLLAWLVYVSHVSTQYVRTLPGVLSLLSTVKESLVTFSVGTSVPGDPGTWIAFGFLAVMVVGLLSLRTSNSHVPLWFRSAFLHGYLFLPLVLGFLISLFRDLFAPRYLMVSAPAFFLVLGLGVVGLFRVAPPAGAASCLFLIGAEVFSLHSALTNPDFNKAESADAISYVEQHLSPDDGIVLDGYDQETQFWYYNSVRAPQPAPSYQYPLLGSDPWGRMPASIDTVMAQQQGVWLLDYSLLAVDPKRLVETYLAQNYYWAYYHVVGRNRVVYYAAPPSTAPTVTPLGDVCNGQLALEDFQSYGASVKPGEIVPLALRWQAVGPTRPDYVVSWRLTDAAGHVVVQHDSEPVAGFSPSSTWQKGEEVVDRFGLLVPGNLPPGSYSLAIVAYDKKSGSACTFKHGDSVIPGIALPLEPIQVADAMPRSALETPPPAYRAQAAVGGLTFLGSDLAAGPYHPGEVAAVRLSWQVDKRLTADDDIEERLVSADGKTLLDKRIGLGPVGYPTSQWRPGRTVATYIDVAIPADASTGTDRLILTVVGRGPDSVQLPNLSKINVVARLRSFTEPPIPFPLNAVFGGVIQLLGYDLNPLPDSEVAPGDPIRVILYWQGDQEMSKSYKVFTHLVGADGKIYGQEDAIPLAGEAPTNGWVPGEIVTDPYDIIVSPTAPAGLYQLVVGLYDSTSSQRLALANEVGDSLDLASITVAH
jgi:mannosyltransferase